MVRFIAEFKFTIG